tara:strand:+ start:187 stop:411 length:225 start_codon:yes stop_codon:yes gene_type:complete
MKIADYRDDMHKLLVRVDTRQEEIFHRVDRIDKHLEKLNNKVAMHENALVKIRTIGVIFVLIIPVIVNLVMREI